MTPYLWLPRPSPHPLEYTKRATLFLVEIMRIIEVLRDALKLGETPTQKSTNW